MFDVGTRVVVLASSVKKGFGTKQGSIGYVSNRQQIAYIHHIKPHRYLSFLATPTIIAFSRYGYEEKRRCEFRTVISVIPAFIGNILKKDAIQEVEKIVDIFQGEEFSKNPLWKDWLSNTFKSVDPKLAVLAPAGNLRIENMLNHPTDVRAWMESILRSQAMGPVLVANKHNNEIFYPQIDSSLITMVSNAHRSRSTLRHLMDWAMANPENLGKIITHIRALSTVYNLRTRQYQLEFFKRTLKGRNYGGVQDGDKPPRDINGNVKGYSPPFNFEGFFNTYMSAFFEKSQMKEKEVVAGQSKSSQIREIAKGMRYVRSAMTRLVPKTIIKE